MLKYAKVINEQTGLCNVGLGSNIKFYKSIGMSRKNVQQSNIDGQWYLSNKCPMKTEAELLQEAKESKYLEANQKAKEYLESGNALYELTQTRHIEATDGNIGKLTAYALGYVTGLYKPTDSVYWNTKEDETIALSQEELGEILSGLGQVQANVWNIQYPQYLAQIESAKTAQEINSIEVEYSDVLMS